MTRKNALEAGSCVCVSWVTQPGVFEAQKKGWQGFDGLQNMKI